MGILTPSSTQKLAALREREREREREEGRDGGMDGWMDGWMDGLWNMGIVFVSIHVIMLLYFHREHVYNIFCFISNIP